MTVEYFKRLEHDKKWKLDQKEKKKIVLAENSPSVKKNNMYEAYRLRQTCSTFDRQKRSVESRFVQNQEEIHRLQESICSPVSCNLGEALQHVGLAEVLGCLEKPATRTLRQKPGKLKAKPKQGKSFKKVNFTDNWQKGQKVQRDVFL